MKSRSSYLFALVYTAIILYLSLRPIPENIGSIFKYQDKFMHIGSYFLLMILYLRIIPLKGVAVILTIGIGIIIEHLQPLTGYRYFEIGDIVANSIGVLLALPLNYYLKVHLPNQTYSPS